MEDGNVASLVIDTTKGAQSSIMSLHFGDLRSTGDDAVSVPVPPAGEDVLAAGPTSDLTVHVESFGYTKDLLIFQQDIEFIQDGNWLRHCVADNWLLVSSTESNRDFYAADRANGMLQNIHAEANPFWTVQGAVKLTNKRFYASTNWIIDTMADSKYQLPVEVFSELREVIESLGGVLIDSHQDTVLIGNCFHILDSHLMPSLMFRFGNDEGDDGFTVFVPPSLSVGREGPPFIGPLKNDGTCELLASSSDSNSIRFPVLILEQLFTMFDSDKMTVSMCYPRPESMKPIVDSPYPGAVLVDRSFDLDTMKPLVEVVVADELYLMSLESAYELDFLYTSGKGQENIAPIVDEGEIPIQGSVMSEVTIGTFEFETRMHIVHAGDDGREMEGDGVISCSFESAFADAAGVFSLFTDTQQRSWLIIGDDARADGGSVPIHYYPVKPAGNGFRQEWFVKGSVKGGIAGSEVPVTWIVDTGSDSVYDVPAEIFDDVKSKIEATGAVIDLDSGVISECSLLKNNGLNLPYISYGIGANIQILVKPTVHHEIPQDTPFDVVHAGYISFSVDGGADTCRLLLTSDRSYVPAMDAFKLPLAVLDSLYIVFDKAQSRLGFSVTND
jgi:hypothetical protein